MRGVWRLGGRAYMMTPTYAHWELQFFAFALGPTTIRWVLWECH